MMRLVLTVAVLWCLAVPTGIYAQDSQEPIADKTAAAETSATDPETDERETTGGDWYWELDVGIPLLLFPHNGYFGRYKDADNNLGVRVAASLSYARFRFETGYLMRSTNRGEHDISYRNNAAVGESTSESDLVQTEILFYWLRNDPHRISYIGGGPIRVKVEEEFSFETATGTKKEEQTTEGSGWKLVVGGKDRGSRLKAYFSYSFTKIEPKIGADYYIGGYSFGFDLSFGGP